MTGRVHRDAGSGRYQLWYQAWSGPTARDGTRSCVVCYSQGATGADDTKQISGIGLGTIPRDRFAGIRPIVQSDQSTLRKPLENIGQVTLRPLDLSGCERITINADASKGSVRVELLDAEGRRVRGFAREDAVPLRGDSLGHAAAWKDRDLKTLPPGRYHVRLHLERATVYALTLARATGGPSSAADGR